MSGGPMLLEMCRRDRVVPVVSAVVRHSFGDSSFFTGLSDFVIQLRGTSMALTGPRVLAIGTSERVTMEELGGVGVHSNQPFTLAVWPRFNRLESHRNAMLFFMDTW